MTAFLSGVITMGFVVAGLFFLRFWWRTDDMLFAVFAVAFWLFALNQALVTILDLGREEQSWIYVLRLAGFALIIVAIFIKNTKREPR